MYSYTAVVEYFDKNKAQRTVRKTVSAKNIKEAEKKLKNLGNLITIQWEEVPNIAADLQLELFT
jgi:hypothetical protein